MEGNFSPKVALIFTGTFIGVVLASLGYVAGKPATPELVSGIKNLMHFMPVVFASLGIIVMLGFNKLKMSKVLEIQKEQSNQGNVV